MPDDQLSPAVSTFTANLRKARKQAGLTQEQVALASGIPQAHYSRIETGKRDPGIRTLIRIATALKTTPADLLSGIS